MVCSLLCQKDGIRRLGPGLYGLTPETRIGTNLQYLRAYLVAPELLRELGDTANAARYEQQAKRVADAARTAYLKNGTVGATWQLNTLVVLAGLASHDDAIWSKVLSHVEQDSPADPVISPTSTLICSMRCRGPATGARLSTGYGNTGAVCWPKGRPVSG